MKEKTRIGLMNLARRVELLATSGYFADILEQSHGYDKKGSGHADQKHGDKNLGQKRDEYVHRPILPVDDRRRDDLTTIREIPARCWALTVLSGVLQVLPFPISGPVPVWRTYLCWIALLPLLAAILSNDRRGRPLKVWQAALLGYMCGVIWYMGSCYWIYQTMYLYGGLAKPVALGILLLFSLYLGLYHATFAALIGSFRRSSRIGREGALLLTPFAWVAVELGRARITGLPWDLLGIAGVNNPLLIHLPPITGAYGISFVIALVNALWLARVRLKDRRFTRPALTLGGVILVLVYVLEVRRMRVPFATTSAVATLLQENLEVGAAATGPPESVDKLLDAFTYRSLHPAFSFYGGIPGLRETKFFDASKLTALSGGVNFDEQAPVVPTSLIVWPESPAPFEEADPAFRIRMSRLASVAHAPVIVGNIGVESVPKSTENPRGTELRNSASFVQPDGRFAGRYDKMHLVPFGEYVPFKRLFFFAGHLLDEVGTFTPGRDRTVFAASNGHRYGIFICYESIFADEIRRFVLGGADVLVNISNDGWYGDTSAPWQHLNMARMRAVENHRWVLRATNTGLTSAIDPYGRVTAAAPRHIRTAITVSFGYEHDLTFYAAHGDLFAYLCSFVTSAALALGFNRKSRAPVN